MDCSNEYWGNWGCQGGWQYYAWYYTQYYGLEAEEDYDPNADKYFGEGEMDQVDNIPDDKKPDHARIGEAVYRVAKELQEYISTLEKIRAPVIAAIHGGCIGGAVDLDRGNTLTGSTWGCRRRPRQPWLHGALSTVTLG